MLFGKKKKGDLDQYLIDILDAQDADIVIVRGKDCKTLFLNAAARARMQLSDMSADNCKNGYSRLFPRICHMCSHMDESKAQHSNFEVEDESGNIFDVTVSSLEWVDDKPVTMLALRDVSEARNAERKMYNLAYVDQLTGIPNRTKLREDFEHISDDVSAGKYVGALALFDLDNFKNINDNYGHTTGDIMLRRLAEHLESDANFRGNLYRLGGDEFVILLVDEPARFSSHEVLRDHYETVLRGALQSYTMPNIDSACTISMGIAFFPRHGDIMGELLRKADIALYKAKAAGRNCMETFQEHYDTVKKLKDLYVSIQPILSATGKTYGYELIDRGNDGNDDQDEVNLSEFNRTLDALGLDDIENNSKFFIAFTEQLLDASVRKNLPKDKFITLANGAFAKKPEYLKRYQDLKKFGYSIAATGLQSEDATLLNMVDYCKFERGAMSEITENRIIKAHPELRFIADNVNTKQDFERAKERGFRLFQGFFFNQPAVVKNTKEIDPLKVNYYRLLKLTSGDSYVDFREIAQIISSDVALSYKLLRLLNSAAVGLRYKVSSISMAVAYLGEENLKRWISLLALRGLGDDKPLELMRMSLIRARFAELLAPHFRPRRNPNTMFLIGMFSLLHIALNKSQEELFAEMPVSEDISSSLMSKNGIYSDIVPFFSHYEYANWDEVSHFAEEKHIETSLISEFYMSAVKWYNDLVGE